MFRNSWLCRSKLTDSFVHGHLIVTLDILHFKIFLCLGTLQNHQNKLCGFSEFATTGCMLLWSVLIGISTVSSKQIITVSD